jgi:hypothetical protein
MNSPFNSSFFHLRFDFSVELGFLDLARKPLTESEYANSCQREKLVYSNDHLLAHYEKRATYPSSLYVVFGGCVPKGRTSAAPFVTDGKVWIIPPLRGLFGEVLARARNSVGAKQGDYPFLFPGPLPKPLEKTVFPTFAVFHDTQDSQAVIAQYREAMAMMRRLNASAWGA